MLYLHIRSKKMRCYLSVLFFVFCISLNAQHKCGAKEYTDYLIEHNPRYAVEKEKVNLETKIGFPIGIVKKNQILLLFCGCSCSLGNQHTKYI